jgi:hypothetical protein
MPRKLKTAEKFDGRFVVITNDDTLSREDVALGYEGAWIAAADLGACEALRPRPADAVRRSRSAASCLWARITHELSALKAVRYCTGGRKSPPASAAS